MDDCFWEFRWRAFFRRMDRLLACLIVLVLLTGFLGARPAWAQQFNNPTYIPTALTPSATLSAAGDYVVQLQGAGTAYLEITGSGTGIAGVVQVSADRNGTPTWTQVTANKVGYGVVNSIASTGLYRINVAGYAALRLHLTAVTGSIAVAAAAGPGDHDVTQLPRQRATFSYAALIGTGATTHFFGINGSATRTVRVHSVECGGFATTAISERITAEMTSAADTGDAGTAVTAVPHDSTDVAATAIALTHTTSPTSGALVGLVRAGGLTLSNAATVFGNTLRWDFGGIRPGAQEIVLRGVAQGFWLNTSAAFGSGGSVGCSIETSEE